MSEIQRRIINSSSDTFNQISTIISEFSIDTWYWLVNDIKDSPEHKWWVIGASAVAMLIILILMKRTRFF